MIRAHSSMTVLQLKVLVRQRDGTPCHQCKLFQPQHGYLANEKSLKDYAISAASSVYIVYDQSAPQTGPPSPTAEQGEQQKCSVLSGALLDPSGFDFRTVPGKETFMLPVMYTTAATTEPATAAEPEKKAAAVTAPSSHTALVAQQQQQPQQQLQLQQPQQQQPQTADLGELTDVGAALAAGELPAGLSEDEVLDGFRLLDVGGVDLPEEITRVVMHGIEPPLRAVYKPHMDMFVSLTYLDVGGNHFQLSDFDCFPALQNLQLGCNHIAALSLPDYEWPPAGAEAEHQQQQPADSAASPNAKLDSPAAGGAAGGASPAAALEAKAVASNPAASPDKALASPSAPLDALVKATEGPAAEPAVFRPFGALQTLDLSYNVLAGHPETILQLGKLPALTELSLAGNDLPALPADMSGFAELKRLSLRRNRLGEQLREAVKTRGKKMLPALRTTSPIGSKVSTPRRELTMSALMQQLESDDAPSDAGAGASTTAASPSRDQLAAQADQQRERLRELRKNRDYACFAALATIPNLEEVDLSENHIFAFPDSLPVFHKLRFLNMGYNFVSSQQDLLPVGASCPVLEWLDVRGNLFNQQRLHSMPKPEDFSELMRELVQGHSIHVIFAQPKDDSAAKEMRHIMRPQTAGTSLPPTRGNAAAASATPGDLHPAERMTRLFAGVHGATAKMTDAELEQMAQRELARQDKLSAAASTAAAQGAATPQQPQQRQQQEQSQQQQPQQQGESKRAVASPIAPASVEAEAEEKEEDVEPVPRDDTFLTNFSADDLERALQAADEKRMTRTVRPDGKSGGQAKLRATSKNALRLAVARPSPPHVKAPKEKPELSSRGASASKPVSAQKPRPAPAKAAAKASTKLAPPAATVAAEALMEDTTSVSGASSGITKRKQALRQDARDRKAVDELLGVVGDVYKKQKDAQRTAAALREQSLTLAAM